VFDVLSQETCRLLITTHFGGKWSLLLLYALCHYCGIFLLGVDFMTDFSRHHPLPLFCFFAAAILVTLITYHPVVSALSLLFSFFYSVYKKPFKKILLIVLFDMFIIVFITLTNSAFTNQGDTVLFAVGKIAFTREEILYGLVLSALLTAVLSWFNFMNALFSNDKFLYLFGKILPRTALILSLSLKSIPMFRKKAEAIRDGQTGLGLKVKNRFKHRLGNEVRIFGGLFSWAFEKAFDTAAAMKARAYGLKKRSSYSRYYFGGRDLFLIIFIIVFTGVFFWGKWTGTLNYSFYPRLANINYNIFPLIVYFACGLFFAGPLISEISETIKWHNLKFTT